MKQIYLAIATLSLVFSSCEKQQSPDVFFSLTASDKIFEYERPVIHVSRTEAVDMYIPCQAVIDGEPVTILNAAGTTLLNMPEQDISLPRLAPGKHHIELVFGNARRLYRDAEAACGERLKSGALDIEVMQSTRKVMAFTFPRTDVDCYVFMPDDDTAIECNTGKEYALKDITVLPAEYTVNVYPFSSQKDDLQISHVGDRIEVKQIETLIGRGIEITMKGQLDKQNENSAFHLHAGGTDYAIQVMN
ncbi:MAG: hypothetical protein KBT08_11610 [Bacteroidales bacterium]|nr:hypothetical protein [Candidatus Cryptobacteroides onthequi]